MRGTRRPSKVQGWYWRGVFRLATRRTLHGVTVGVLWPDADDAEAIFSKVEAALRLLARHDRRRFDRLSRATGGIVVLGTAGALAEWIQGPRLMRIRENYVLDPGASPGHLASTIVHEGTHAWLWRLGFGYDESDRARIEAICYRSEIAFVRRLADAEHLLPELEGALTRDPAEYSEAARRARTLAAFRAVGAPKWLVRLLAFATR